MAQETSAVRTVYDFPVAAHLCIDGIVRYTKLIRRARAEQPHGPLGGAQCGCQRCGAVVGRAVVWLARRPVRASGGPAVCPRRAQSAARG